MNKTLAAVRVRDCRVTRSEILFTPKQGGVIRVQTNRTGNQWAYVSRDTYNGIVNAIDAPCPIGGETVRKWLLNATVTIRAEQRAFGAFDRYVMWFARVEEITGVIALQGDYRMGRRNRG